jgi:hypothetical protein
MSTQQKRAHLMHSGNRSLPRSPQMSSFQQRIFDPKNESLDKILLKGLSSEMDLAESRLIRN